MKLDERQAGHAGASAAEAADIAEQFRAVAARQPAALALTAEGRSWTYSEIDGWSDAIASELMALEAPRDRAIAIVPRNNVALVPAILAVVKAGHFCVVIDGLDPAPRISFLLAEANASLVLTDAVEEFRNVANGRRLVAIGEAPPSRAVGVERRPPNPFVQLQFTSGTSGRPKGVMMRHEVFLDHVTRRARSFDKAPGERVSYMALPGFTRSATSVIGTLLTGATLCAFDARGSSIAALGDFIVRERITLLSLTPALFRRLTRESRAVDFSSVKRFKLSADVITPADVEAFKAHFPRGCTLDRGYASTETGNVCQMRIDHDTPVPGPLVPMGRVRTGVDVRVVDESEKDVAPGDVGELIVRGSQVADGYWNDPELTATKFFTGPDGVRAFRTGDLVRRDPDGLFYFVGRADARVKIYGRRIDPLEVEAALVATPDVREAVAVAKPDHFGDLRLVAYVVMRPGAACRPREIRAALRSSSPAWMVPSRIIELPEIPVTPAGKVDRKALSARVDAEVGREDSGAVNDLEERLAAIWSRVIGTSVHVEDDFFDDLGAESVVAAHLVTAIEDELEQSIPLSLLAEQNTVRKLARWMTDSRGVKPFAIMLARGDGTIPPLFCISGAGDTVLVFRPLARSLGPEQPFYGLQPHGFDRANLPATYRDVLETYARAIRAIQPSGPYYLAGYSSGGRQAFELARYFVGIGEKVAFVGAIDTLLTRRALPWKKRLTNRLRLFVQTPRSALHLPGEARVRAQRWLVARASARGLEIPEWMNDFRISMRRVKSTMESGPYPGKVTLFRATDGIRTSAADENLGWGDVEADGLEVIDVVGNHLSVLSEPESLGRALKEKLRDLRATEAHAEIAE